MPPLPPSTNHTHTLTLPSPISGRGLFTTKSLKAGDLILAVNHPPLSIIYGKNLERVCDGCLRFFDFDIVVRDEERRKGPVECEGCGVLWYCDEKCRSKAWQTHHQHECHIFSHILNSETETTPPSCRISYDILRCSIRLLAMGQNGAIDLQTYKDLDPGRLEDQVLVDVMEIAQTIWRMEMIAWEGLEDVERIVSIVYNNSGSLDTWRASPPQQLNDYTQFLFRDAGIFIDPHYSMMNHSCAPNASWLFIGSQLQVRAEKDIQAGEEVTISYVGRGDAIMRREELEWRGFVCRCDICKGVEGCCELCVRENGFMERETHDKIMSVLESEERSVEVVKKQIKELEGKGWKWGVWPLADLYENAAKWTEDHREGVKCLLHIRYEHQVSEKPATTSYERVRVLVFLVQKVGRIREGMEGKSLGDEWGDEVWAGLREGLLVEVRGCFGVESDLVRWEEERFVKEFGREPVMEGKVVRQRLKPLLALVGLS